MLAPTRAADDHGGVVTALVIAAVWLLLSVLATAVFGAICHGAELGEHRH